MSDRATSPLCDATYREPSTVWPRWKTPAWMRLGMWGGVVIAVATAAAALAGPMDERILARGEVRPEQWSLAYPARAGVLATIAVRPGDTVSVGQEIARLDDVTTRADLAQLTAAIAEADALTAESEANRDRTIALPIAAEFLFNAFDLDRQRSILKDQQAALTKMEELFARGGTSDLQLLTQRQQVSTNHMTLARSEKAALAVEHGYGEAAIAEAQAKARAASARADGLRSQFVARTADLDRHVIRARIAGTVIAVGVRFPGERVDLGVAVAKIAASSRPMLRLSASEDRIAELAPGQIVRFRPRSDPDRLAGMRTGRVLEVGIDRDLETTAGADPAGRPYRILVAVDDDRRALPWGAQVDAEIVVRERSFWRLLTLAETAPR